VLITCGFYLLQLHQAAAITLVGRAATGDLHSVNARIECLLREALTRRGLGWVGPITRPLHRSR
jgi:hypothetical protein